MVKELAGWAKCTAVILESFIMCRPHCTVLLFILITAVSVVGQSSHLLLESFHSKHTIREQPRLGVLFMQCSMVLLIGVQSHGYHPSYAHDRLT